MPLARGGRVAGRNRCNRRATAAKSLRGLTAVLLLAFWKASSFRSWLCALPIPDLNRIVEIGRDHGIEFFKEERANTQVAF